VNHFVLGSEGILGVITEAVFRIRPAPHAKAPTSSARLGSARLGSARLGSARLGSARP
jgi:FAD/FMN-containing dehydrogenase